MNDEPLEDWIGKAEQDFQYAQLGMRRRKSPLYDGVCFHSQQCAEKYLKAFLVRHQIKFRKVHDLDELYNLSARVDESFKLIFGALMILNPYSVDIRYPGASATKDDARDAVAAMKQVRAFVRARLGLKSK
ncbi:MAG: HEPN domain-containing protein [Chloroflexota bacterium]